MTQHTATWALAACASTLAFGCASDLRDDAEPDMPEPAAPIVNLALADGVTRTTIDATDAERFVYFDFESKALVTPDTPSDAQDWDLGLLRFRIQINGGVSGTGQMELARLDRADFDALDRAPVDGYVTDQADGDDENTDPDLAFSSGELAWYAYDSMHHTLTPHDRVYVLRAVGSRYYKLQMLEYYDKAGTGGFPAFRWAEIAAP